MSTASTVEKVAERPPSDVAPEVRPRLESVDILRGAVMVLMVLDHVRDYFMDPRLLPTDLSRASAPLFLTRWVTHFCAPTFTFLAGTGAYLWSVRSPAKTKPELARFLLTRGLWLIVLEETASKFGMFFNIAPGFLLGGVLWAIGWSMIALAALVFLPMPAILGFAVAMIAGHNLLDRYRSSHFGALAPVWKVLHEQGPVLLPGGFVLFAFYPLIPWIGVMAAGYTLGPILMQKPELRRRNLIGLGFGLILAFVVIRAINLYGDLGPWTTQRSALFTALSFLNCQKYPPSLLYLLMTLGPALVALGLLDRGLGRLGVPLRTLGRVPLFFWILQWFVAHGLAVVVNAARGLPTAWLFAMPPFQSPPGCHYGLPMVYLMWALSLAILYLPCRWFAELKRTRRDAWLSYF